MEPLYTRRVRGHDDRLEDAGKAAGQILGLWLQVMSRATQNYGGRRRLDAGSQKRPGRHISYRIS